MQSFIYVATIGPSITRKSLYKRLGKFDYALRILLDQR